MFRLLVVEDHDDFYEDYLLRIFKKTLPMDKITIVRAADLAQALEVLPEPWDMMLMDYSLGAATEYHEETVKNGADLVGIRRVMETKPEGAIKMSYIVGMSSNGASNRLILHQGADRTISKLEVERMSRLVKGAMKSSE
jgi:CheY-like chemotaxis protein